MGTLLRASIVAVAFTGAFTALALLAQRFIGCSCKCGRRARRFDELLEEDKVDILAYFGEVEEREPDTAGIFVCDACGQLWDDFSGEKTSLDCDNVSMCKVCGYSIGKLPVTYLGNFVGFPGYAKVYSQFIEHNRQFVDKIECLRCERGPATVSDCFVCKADPKVHGCPECFTLYTWTKWRGSKYAYLVPLTTAKLQDHAIDPTLGWL